MLSRHRRHHPTDRSPARVISTVMEASSVGSGNEEAGGGSLRALVAGFPGAAIHLKGKQLWFNSFTESLIGYHPSQLADVDQFFAVVFPGSAPRVRATYERSRAAGFPQPDVLTLIRNDGAHRMVEFSGFSGDGEEVWFLRDLTDAHRAGEALRDREQRLDVAVKVARLGTWEWDVGTGRLVGDDTARRLFGIGDTSDEETYEAYLDRVHRDDRSLLENAVNEAIRRRSAFDVEIRVRRGESRTRWVRIRGMVDYETAERPRVVAAVQDIDDHKRLDEQLIHAARMESLGQLAGCIAHDFNNLLVVIQGHLEFVADERGLSATAARRVDSIASAVARGADLVASLMQLGRSSASTTGPVDLNAWLVAAADTLRQLVGEDISVEYQLDARPRYVDMDEARLASVVLNLASNARDAMPSGGVLRIATRDAIPKPGLATDADLGGVNLIVADTGIGMDRATRKKIFEPFFTTKAPGVGTGLGLASAYEAVLDAGGEIDVASVPEEGATFTIFLPTVAEPPADVTTPPESTPVPVQEGLILIAEDDAEVLELAADILRSAGYRVLEALGPHEALEYVAAGETPDLLLADVVMPDLSGPALATRLLERLPDLLVLYMSGYASAGRTGVEIPPNDLVRKPFSHAELLERVAAALPHRRSQDLGRARSSK